MNERFVLDSSAVLAVVFGEPGDQRVASLLGAALVSAVNLSEAAAKMNERGFDATETRHLLTGLGFDVAGFGEADAYAAGELRNRTRAAGLSLGDRACLALALRERAGVITADRAWTNLNIDVTVELLR